MIAATFISTNRRTFLAVTAASSVLAAFGSVLLGTGSVNTILAIIVLTVLFAVTADRSIRLRDLGVSTKRWLNSALFTGILVSLIATALIMAAIILGNPTTEGLGYGFGSFTVSSDAAGGGAPDEGMSAKQLVLSGICVFLSFLMLITAGTALGAVRGAKGTRAFLWVLGAVVVSAYAVALVLDSLDATPAAPWPGVPVFAVVVIGFSAIGLAWSLKLEPRPLPAVVPEFAAAN